MNTYYLSIFVDSVDGITLNDDQTNRPKGDKITIKATAPLGAPNIFFNSPYLATTEH